MNINKKLVKDIETKVPKKRLIQAGAVTLAMTAMIGTASFAASTNVNEVSTAGTSGIVASLYDGDEATLQIASSGVKAVGLDSDSAQWILSLMTDASDYAYVRTAPDDNADVAGKLRRGDMARVEALTDSGWYQITSGNLTGYIKADVSVTGQACKDLATAVGYNGSTGITTAEEEEQVAALKAAAAEAAKQAAAKQAAASSSSSGSSYTQKASYAATADEVTLLAAIVEKEDGSDGYEGQLAVASAIMNRVRSSRYPNNIYDVIDQKGQFVGGVAGLSNILARGPSATSRRAAEAALAGADTVNGMTNFRAWYTGHSGTRIGLHVFF